MAQPALMICPRCGAVARPNVPTFCHACQHGRVKVEPEPMGLPPPHAPNFGGEPLAKNPWEPT